MNSRVFWYCFVFVVGLISVPAELYVSLGGVRIEPYRIGLIMILFLFVPVIARTKFQLFEYMLIAYCIWGGLSFLYLYGVGGLESAIVQFLEVFVAYFVGRSVAQYYESTEKMLKCWLLLFVVLAPFAVIESLSGYRLLHVVAGQLSGNGAIESLGEDYYRFGVHRSSTVFSHPILFSVGASMLFIYVLIHRFRYRVLAFGSLLTALVTAMSSVGFLMVALQLAVVCVEYISKKFSYFKSALVWFFLFGVIFVEAFSNRGFIKVGLSILSLNPQTSYMRYMQWEFASDDVVDNPIFGIGFGEWSRPSWMPFSIDNYWLLTALVNGLPALLFLCLFWWGLFRFGMRAYSIHCDRMILVFCASLVSLFVAGITVDFFDRAQIYVYLFLGVFAGYFIRVRRLEGSL